MSTVPSAWTRRSSKIAAGVVALAAGGVVASLALTGPAVAEGGKYEGGWPTHFATGSDGSRVARGPDARTVIRLKAREVRAAEADVDGDGRFDPGDYDVFEEKLIHDHQKVGRDAVTCMRIVRTIQCDGSLKLTGQGMLTVAGGIYRTDPGIEIAVTGGTGAFRDAAGTMTVRGGPRNTSRFIIRLVD